MATITTATRELLKLKKKIRAVSGGTGASKTYSIIMILIDYAQANENQKIDVVSESYPHLEDGAIRDFKEILISQNYWQDNRWNGTQHTYQFETSSIIKFLSFDKLGKAHGPRRDVLFLNECNYLPFNTIDQLITRTRKIVWMDWNPSEEFWFYTEIQGKREDVDFIKLTYLDNEALSDSERQEIESRKSNTNWWKVYGLGELGVIEGRIYKDWQIIEELPKEARLERRWLDFGYSVDESAIGEIYYHNGGYILNEQLYQKGLSNKQLADFILNLPNPKTLLVADSAEPKSIDELKSFGLNVVPSVKGKDSVNYGVQIVQDQKILVTANSPNIWKEYKNYLWMTDKNGKIIKVEDSRCKNHHMAGIRYATTSIVPIKRRQEYIRSLPMVHRSTPKVNPAR